MKIDVDDRDVFNLSGPTFLSQLRSFQAEHKQALVAALTQAVYVAEKDRQFGKQGVYALAPRWWNSLGYEPTRFIYEEQSEQIIGAVFKRKPCSSPKSEEETMEAAPMIVVALRGTMPHGEAIVSDLATDLWLLLQQLHTTTRYVTVLEAIKIAAQEVGLNNLCIAGHSLGAALALLAARTLASDGSLIDTHLFNPPFPSPPLERIRSKRWQLALHVLRMTSLVGLSRFLLDSDSRQLAFNAFFALKHWLPHLYLNANDPFCSSYIGFFNSCEFLQRIGAGTLAQLAAPLSLRGSVQHYFFGECKPFHLIPCANLHVVEKSSRKLLQAHGLHQWWSPKLKFVHWQAKLDVKQHSEDVDVDESM